MGFLKTFLSFNFFTSDPVGSNAEFKRAVNVYNYMDSLAYTKGNHQIKVGVDVRRYLFNAYNVGPNIFLFTGARAREIPWQISFGDCRRMTVSFEGSPTGNTTQV